MPSPASAVLRGHYDSPPSVPPRSVALAWRYRRPALSSLPPTPRGRAEGPGGLGCRVPPVRLPRRRRPGLPRSRGTLLRPCPALRPRPTRRRQALRRHGMAPANTTTKAPAIELSGLHVTASALACPGLTGRLPGTRAGFASGGWPSPAGWDWLPTGSLRKVSECYLISSPSPAPRGARYPHDVVLALPARMP